MGQRSYPPLKLREVLAILRSLGFSLKRQDSSHAQYERPADSIRRRSVVTVDMGIREFGERLIRSMIRQSNHTKEEFYGALDK